ncbi:MAG: glycan-binding surface protein [Ferruginibacter sp.]
MKKINKLFLLLTMAIATISLISSCSKKDDLVNNGVPSIKYVRVTNPESSDSLLVGASQGKLIAIVGENLQDAVQVWFNDKQANLTPTYVTPTSILVSVPSPIPVVISNKLKIFFANGDSLLYNFEVQISKPVVSSMVCEYGNVGDVVTIRGDYFYMPLTVKFAGGVTGQLESVEDKIIRVRVPAGAQPGPVVVTTNFGVTESDFWFRDNRNIFISSDPFEGWWDPSYVVTNPGPTDPPKISGNYIRVTKSFGEWSWNEIAGGPATAMPLQSKNVPDAAILKPADYNLKFEVNTIKPYNASIIRINVGLTSQDNNAYQWQPPYDTKGQWQTVIIPFEDVVASYSVKPVINPEGYWTRILIQGPGVLDADICLDNFRVVPKVNKK